MTPPERDRLIDILQFWAVILVLAWGHFEQLTPWGFFSGEHDYKIACQSENREWFFLLSLVLALVWMICWIGWGSEWRMYKFFREKMAGEEVTVTDHIRDAQTRTSPASGKMKVWQFVVGLIFLPVVYLFMVVVIFLFFTLAAMFIHSHIN